MRTLIGENMSTGSAIEAGISIPASLVGTMVEIEKVVPNTWNPNRMEAFMREKLRKGIQKDGFIVPVIVRPIGASNRPDREELIKHGVEFEVIDGEHRWEEGGKLGMTRIPIVNLGLVSDTDAQQITVKANALRGDFDSVKLAEMIAGLSAEIGMEAIVDALPYTPERLQAMVDLLNVDSSTLTMMPNTEVAGGAGKTPEPAPPPTEFKQFDGSIMKFDNKCPRCGFEFNNKKEEGDE